MEVEAQRDYYAIEMRATGARARIHRAILVRFAFLHDFVVGAQLGADEVLVFEADLSQEALWWFLAYCALEAVMRDLGLERSVLAQLTIACSPERRSPLLPALVGFTQMPRSAKLEDDDLFAVLRFAHKFGVESIVAELVQRALARIDALFPLDYTPYWPPRPEYPEGLLVDPRFRWAEARQAFEAEKLGVGRFDMLEKFPDLSQLCVAPLKHLNPLAGSFKHTLFRDQSGDLAACGSNMEHETTFPDRGYNVLAPVPQFGKTVVAVAAGTSHSLILLEDGTVWGYGSNKYGQLGWKREALPGEVVIDEEHSALHHRIIASPNVAGVRDLAQVVPYAVVAIACGTIHTAFITFDGRLWTCGRNSRGECGHGTPGEVQYVPRVALEQVVSLACGSALTLATKWDGTVWAAGVYGIVEDGRTVERTARQFTFLGLVASGLAIWSPFVRAGIVGTGKIVFVRPREQDLVAMQAHGHHYSLEKEPVTMVTARSHICWITRAGKARMYGSNTTDCLGDGSLASDDRHFVTALPWQGRILACAVYAGVLSYPLENCADTLLLTGETGEFFGTGKNFRGQLGFAGGASRTAFERNGAVSAYRAPRFDALVTHVMTKRESAALKRIALGEEGVGEEGALTATVLDAAFEELESVALGVRVIRYGIDGSDETLVTVTTENRVGARLGQLRAGQYLRIRDAGTTDLVFDFSRIFPSERRATAVVAEGLLTLLFFTDGGDTLERLLLLPALAAPTTEVMVTQRCHQCLGGHAPLQHPHAQSLMFCSAHCMAAMGHVRGTK